MKKLILAFLLLVLVLPLVAAQPPFKDNTPPGKSKDSGTADRTSGDSEDTGTEVVYVNQTAPARDEGLNWEMIAVVIAVIGTIIGWFISRRMRSKTARYLTEIDNIYKQKKSNPPACQKGLENMRQKIDEEFKKGRINDQALSILEKRIDKYSGELKRGIIDSRFTLPKDLDRKVKHMLSDGIITSDEYKNLKNILKKSEMSEDEKEKLRSLMERWKQKE